MLSLLYVVVIIYVDFLKCLYVCVPACQCTHNKIFGHVGALDREKAIGKVVLNRYGLTITIAMLVSDCPASMIRSSPADCRIARSFSQPFGQTGRKTPSRRMPNNQGSEFIFFCFEHLPYFRSQKDREPD